MVAVQTAIGEKIAFLLMTTITSVFGFFYAYFKCWQLSLILTGFLPLLMISGVLLMKSMQLKAQLGKISYEGASGIAEQVIFFLYRLYLQLEQLKALLPSNLNRQNLFKPFPSLKRKLSSTYFSPPEVWQACSLYFWGSTHLDSGMASN